MPNPPIESTINVLNLRDRLSALVTTHQRSTYRGVKWMANKRRWRMTIRLGGKELAREFQKQEDAARYYDVAASLLYGDNAPPRNFDGQPPQGVSVADVRLSLVKRGLLAKSKPSRPSKEST